MYVPDPRISAMSTRSHELNYVAESDSCKKYSADHHAVKKGAEFSRGPAWVRILSGHADIVS